MRNADPALSVVAALAMLLAGCDSTPTEPRFNAPPNPTPPPGAAKEWDLSVTVTEATGSFCVYLPALGNVFRTTFTLEQSGNSLTFVMSDPLNWNSFTVTTSGLTFSSAPSTHEANICAHYRQINTFSGSFSPDASALTATETWSFALDSGETVTRTLTWSARRTP
jgi:hypothetical protein